MSSTDRPAIRLYFTRASGFVAWAIRAITGGTASHVGIGLPDGRVIHADQGGIQVGSFGQFIGPDRTLHSSYDLVPAEAAQVNVQAILAYLGRPYDYDGLLGALPAVLSWRWFKARLGNPLARDREFFCSEFVVEAMRAASGRPAIMPSQEPGTVTPAALMRWCGRSALWKKV